MMSHPISRRALLLGLATGASAGRLHAQNLVEEDGSRRVLEPVTLGPADFQQLVDRRADFRVAPATPAVAHTRDKLERHVAQMLDQWPLQALQTTLGISGYEAYFNHADLLFHCLIPALPRLTPGLQHRVRTFLDQRLRELPPYALDGYDNTTGQQREPYTIPGVLRLKGRGRAVGTLGVYAFAEYCHAVGEPKTAAEHWSAVKERIAPLLREPYRFDIRKRDYANDEAQRLNGDLAGLVGAARLALSCADTETAAAALHRGTELLQLRVNLERVNPHILERTNSSSKHLHVNKLARYCDLVPEVGEALRRHTEGLAAERLRTFREARPTWELAYAERLIGGENYISPPHLSYALFSGAALVEQLPPDTLLRYQDVPWCKGDLYFILKSALALWAAAGRAWIPAR